MKRLTPDEFLGWLERRRQQGVDPGIQEQVARILAHVAADGDAAVAHWSRELDGVKTGGAIQPLDRAQLQKAWENLDRDLRQALATAAERIQTFHRRQRPVDFAAEEEDGTVLSQRWLPLQRVAVYAPGGRAAYPSTVLMGGVPAQVAGVEELWVATPPGEGGRPPSAMLGAAYAAGADYVLPVGGVQALGALAYGTETVPPVDAIVGPGNAYVQEAKRQLFGRVALDGLYGPSELAVLVAGPVDLRKAAADIIAQVEHAPDNVAVVLAVDEEQLSRLLVEIQAQVPRRLRREIIDSALADNGCAVSCSNTTQALALAEALAPEHLLLVGEEAELLARDVRCAGALFVGVNSPVALGDYVAGTNHCLPTGGTARFASSLGTLNFMRRMSVVEASAEACRRLAGPGAVIADEEGFEAHAYSLRLRQADEGGGSGANV